MKKRNCFRILLILLSLAVSLFSYSCKAEKKEKVEKAEKSLSKDFYIACEGEGEYTKAASLLGDALLSDGFSWDMEIIDMGARDPFSALNSGEYKGVICFGRGVTESFLEKELDIFALYCILDNMPFEPKREIEGISPVISATEMTDVALSLFGDGKYYALISEEKGAWDMQRACDLLDLSGVDYMVEALLERELSDGLASARTEGCNVAIAACRDAIGRWDGKEAGIYTVMLEEGRRASVCFSLDLERVAEEMLSLCKGEGKAREQKKSYYDLYIKSAVRDTLSDSAVGTVSEGYDIIIFP